MARPKKIYGDKFLKFRIDEGTYNLLKNVAEELNIPISEVSRRIIASFILRVMLEKRPKTLSELRKRFRRRYL